MKSIFHQPLGQSQLSLSKEMLNKRHYHTCHWNLIKKSESVEVKSTTMRSHNSILGDQYQILSQNKIYISNQDIWIQVNLWGYEEVISEDKV